MTIVAGGLLFPLLWLFACCCPYLYQLAGHHRYASPQMANRIEQVSRQMAAQSGGRLELVPRESLIRHP